MVRETRHLWVGNLPDNIREERILEHFKRYGRVQSVKLLPKRDEEAGLCATVAFIDIKSAAKAHGSDNQIEERTLKTDYYEPPTSSTATVAIHIHERDDNLLRAAYTPTRNQRYGLSDDRGGYDRSSHYYERAGERDPYMRRPMSYHEEEVYQGRGRTRERTGTSYRAATTGFQTPLERIPGHYRSHNSRQHFESTQLPQQPASQQPLQPAQPRYAADQYSMDDRESVSGRGSRRSSPSRAKVRHGRQRHKSTSRSRSQSGSESPSRSGSRSSCGSRSSSSSSNTRSSSSSDCTHSCSGSGSRSQSPSRAGTKSLRPPDKIASVASPAPQLQSAVSTPNPPTPQQQVSSQTTSNDTLLSISSSPQEKEDKRPLGICVRNLPVRSSDTSLKDGLFHEYKKHGKVTTVKVIGQGTDRYAVVCFKKPEDVEKALEVSKDKLFFGSKIEVTSHEGLDVEDNEFRPLEAELDEFHPKATRTLFIGNLEKDITTAELRKHFEQFGEIIEIDIKKQGAVSSYAFVQYSDIGSVVKAMRKMDGEHLGANRIKLGFGKSMPTNCVWLDGIADTISEKFLMRQFVRFGHVVSTYIDREKGHALVFYERVEYAQIAVPEMRGRALGGKKLQIDFASRECQVAFFEKMEMSGQMLPGDRPWDRREQTFENREERYGRDPRLTFETPGRGFGRFDNHQRGRASLRAGPRGAFASRGRGQGFANRAFDDEFPQGTGTTYDDSYEQELREYGFSQRERRDYSSDDHGRGFSPRRRREDCSMSPKDRLSDSLGTSPHPRIERSTSRYDSGREDEVVDEKRSKFYELDKERPVKKSRQRSVSDQESYHSQSPPNSRHQSRSISPLPKEKRPKERPVNRPLSPGTPLDSPSRDSMVSLDREASTEYSVKRKLSESRTDLLRETSRVDFLVEVDGSARSRTKLDAERSKFRKVLTEDDGCVDRRDCSRESTPSYKDRASSVFRVGESVKLPSVIGLNTRLQKVTVESEQALSLDIESSDKLQVEDNDRESGELVDDFLEKPVPETSTSGLKHLQKEKVHILHLLEHLEHPDEEVVDEAEKRLCKKVKVNDVSRQNCTKDTKDLLPSLLAKVPDLEESTSHKKMEMRRVGVELTKPLEIKTKCSLVDKVDVIRSVSDVSDEVAFVIECSPKDIPAEAHSHKRRRSGIFADNAGLAKLLYRTKHTSEDPLGLNNTDEDLSTSDKLLASKVSGDARLLNLKSPDSKPGTPLVDEPRREKESPLSLPLPRFASSVMSPKHSPKPMLSPKSSVLKSPLLSPTGSNSLHVVLPAGGRELATVADVLVRSNSTGGSLPDKKIPAPGLETRHKSPVSLSPKCTVLRAAKASGLDSSSDSEHSPRLSPNRPSLEERIRILDEKFNAWSGSTRSVSSSASMTSVTGTLNRIDCEKFKKRPSFLSTDITQLRTEPSDIVKSLLAKNSIFDQDSKRLEHVNEKYQPREVTIDPVPKKTFCFRTKAAAKEFLPAFTTASTSSRGTNSIVTLPTARYPFPSTPTTTASTISAPVTTLSSSTATTNTTPSTVMACHVSHGSTLCSSSSTTSYPSVPFSPITPVSTALTSPNTLRQPIESLYKAGSAVITRKPSTEMPKTPILKKDPPSALLSLSPRTPVTTSAGASIFGNLVAISHAVKKEPSSASVARRDSVGSSGKKESKEQLVVKKELVTSNCSSVVNDPLLKKECQVVLSSKDANKHDLTSSGSSKEFKKEFCSNAGTTRELTSPPLVKKEPASASSCSSKDSSSKRESASSCVMINSGKENSRKDNITGNNNPNPNSTPQRRDSSSQSCNKRRLVSADSSESDSSRISMKADAKSDRENKGKSESSRHSEPETKKPKFSSSSITDERKRSDCVTSPCSLVKKSGKSPPSVDKKAGKSDSKSVKKDDKERKNESKSVYEDKVKMDGSRSKDEKRNKFSKDNKELLSKCECRPKSKSIKDKDKKKDKKKDRKDKGDKDKGDKDKGDKDKGDKDKGDKDKGDKDKGDKNKSDKDKGDKEKGEKDKSDKDKNEKDKGEKDKNDKEKIDKDKTDKEKCENDKPKDKKSNEKSKSEGSRRDRKSEKCLSFWEEEPVYFSMYDKVKARSSQNEKAKEKEKELETMREKFSQLKQSRAKREEKVRPSCDYDSERGSDAGSYHSSETSESKLSVSKGKQHGKKRKLIIASDSEDGDLSKEGSSKFHLRQGKTSDEDDFKYEDISECEGMQEKRETKNKSKTPRDLHLAKSDNDSTDTELLKFRENTSERKHKTKGRKKHEKGENRIKLKKKSEDESSDIEGAARTKLHNIKRDKIKRSMVANAHLSEDESGDSETVRMLKEIELLQSTTKEEDEQQLFLAEMESKHRKPPKKESKRKKEKVKGVFADVETSEDEHHEKVKITKRKKSRKSSRSKENKFQEERTSTKSGFEGDGNSLDAHEEGNQLSEPSEHAGCLSKDDHKTDSDPFHKTEQSQVAISLSDDSLLNMAKLEKASRGFAGESDKSDSEPLMPQLIHKEDHEELSESEAHDNSDKYLGSPPMELLEAKWLDDSLPTEEMHTPSLMPVPKLSSTSSKMDDKIESETDQALKVDDFNDSLPTLPPYDLDLNMPSLTELPSREERRHRKSKKASKDRKRRSRDEAPKLEDVYTLTAVNMESTTPLPSAEPEEIIPEKNTPVTVEEPKSRLPDSAELVEAVRILESQLQQTTQERNKMDEPVPCHTDNPSVEDNVVVTADTAVAAIIDDDDDDNDDDKDFAKLVVDESRLDDDERSDHEKDVLDLKQSALDIFEFTDDDIPEIPIKFGRDDHRRSRVPEDEVEVREKKHKGKRKRKGKEEKPKKGETELGHTERTLEPSEDEKEDANEAKAELIDIPLLKEEVSVDKQSAVHDIIPDLLAATESIPLPDLQLLHDQKTEAEPEQESDDKTASAISQEETEDAVKALLQACTFGTDTYDNQDTNMLDEDDMVPKLEPMVSEMDKVEGDDEEAERAVAVLSLEASEMRHLTEAKDIEPLLDETSTFQDNLHKGEGELSEPVSSSKVDVPQLQEEEIGTILPVDATLDSSHIVEKEESLENLVNATNVLTVSPQNMPDSETTKNLEITLDEVKISVQEDKTLAIDKGNDHSSVISEDVNITENTDKESRLVPESCMDDQIDESNEEAKITDTEEMEDETKIKVIEEIVKMLDCEKTEDPVFPPTENKAAIDLHHPALTPPLLPSLLPPSSPRLPSPPPLPPPPPPSSPPPLPVQPVPVELPEKLPQAEEIEAAVSPKSVEPPEQTDLPLTLTETFETAQSELSSVINSELPVCIPSPKTYELDTQSSVGICPPASIDMPILDNMEEKEEPETSSVLAEARPRRPRRGKGKKYSEPVSNPSKSEPAITIEPTVVTTSLTPRSNTKRGRRNQRTEVEPTIEIKDNHDSMPRLEESTVTEDKGAKEAILTKSIVLPEEEVPKTVNPEVKVEDPREEMPPLLESSLEEPAKPELPPPTQDKHCEELVMEKSLDLHKTEEPRNRRRGRKKKSESHSALPSPPTLEKMEVKPEEVEEFKIKENRFDTRLKTSEPKSALGAKENMFDVFEFRDDEEDDTVTFFESSKERKDDHKFSEVRFHVDSDSTKREEPERPIEPAVREEKEVATVERTRPRLILTIKSPHKDSHEKVAKVETREEPAVRIVEHRTDDHRGDSFSATHSTIVASRSESAEHSGTEKGLSTQSPNKSPATRKSQRLQEKSYRTTIDEVIEDVVKGHFHTMDDFEQPSNTIRSTRRTRSRGRAEEAQPAAQTASLPNEKPESTALPQIQEVAVTRTAADTAIIKPEMAEEEMVIDVDPSSMQQDTGAASTADVTKPTVLETSEAHRPVSLRTFRITRTQCRGEFGKAEFQTAAIMPQDSVGSAVLLKSEPLPEAKEDESAVREPTTSEAKGSETTAPAHIKDTLLQPKDVTATDPSVPVNDSKAESKDKTPSVDKPIPLQTQLVMKVELPKVSQAVSAGKTNSHSTSVAHDTEQITASVSATAQVPVSEEKEADSSPTALVDPVTGFLTPVRQSEEGTYIPAMTTSASVVSFSKDGSSMSKLTGTTKIPQPLPARSPVVVCSKTLPLPPTSTVAVATGSQLQMPPPATTSTGPVARSPQPLSQLALMPKSPHPTVVQPHTAGVKDEPEQASQSRSRSQSLPRLSTAFVGEPPVDISSRSRSQSLTSATVSPDHDNRLLHPSVVTRPPPQIGQPMPGVPPYSSSMAGIPPYSQGSYSQQLSSQSSVHTTKAPSPHSPVVSGYGHGTKAAASLKPPSTSPIGVIGMPPVATTAVSVVKATPIASSKMNTSGRVGDASSLVRVNSAEVPVVYKTEPGIPVSTCAGKVPTQRSSELLSQPHIMSDISQPRGSKAQTAACSSSKSSITPRHSPVIPQQASYPIPAYETALHASHTYGSAATGGGGIADLLQNPNYLLQQQHKNYPLPHHSTGQLLERVPSQIVRPGNPVAVHPEVAARLGNPTPPHTPTPPTHPSITGQTDMIHLRHPSQPMVVHPHHTHPHMPAYVHPQLVYANHPHYATVLHQDLRAQQAAALQGMQARMPYAASAGATTMRHPPDAKECKDVRAESKHPSSIKDEKSVERQDDRSMAMEANRPSTSDSVAASRNQSVVAVGQPPVRQPQAQYPSVIPPLRQVTPHLTPSPHDRATDSPIIAILYNKGPTRHPYPRTDQEKLPGDVRAHEGESLHARSLTSQPSMVYLDSRSQTASGQIANLTKQEVHRQSQQPPMQQARSRSPAASMRPPSPPPAHIRSLGGNYLQSGCTPQPASEAPLHPVLVAQPMVQPRTQLQTPPHASQVPPQGDSLLMLLQRYPVMWQGLLALKNDQAAVQMHFVSGNHNVALHSLPSLSEGGTPPLRIAQRMRLEQTQLEGVARRMQMEGEHCMLLALPCGRDHMDVLQQSNNLRNGFITYLQQKQAAGIVNVAAPGSQQPAYVVHIFPSCDFSNENLARIAPDLLHSVADIAHLLIVVATV